MVERTSPLEVSGMAPRLVIAAVPAFLGFLVLRVKKSLNREILYEVL
jgi:hypothetical protein